MNLSVSRDDFLRCFKHRVVLNRDRWGTVVRHGIRVQNIGTEEEPFLVIPLELSDRCTVGNDSSGISCLEDDIVVVSKADNVKGMRTTASYPFQSIVPDEFKDCISVVAEVESGNMESVSAEQGEVISEVPEVFRKYLTLSVNSTSALNGAVSGEENMVNNMENVVVDTVTTDTAVTAVTSVTDDTAVTSVTSVTDGIDDTAVTSVTDGIEVVGMGVFGGTEETADKAEGVQSADVTMAVDSDGVNSEVTAVVDTVMNSGGGKMANGANVDRVVCVPMDAVDAVLDTHGDGAESAKERSIETMVSADTVAEQTVFGGTDVGDSGHEAVVSAHDDSGGTGGEEDKKVTLLDGTPVPNGIIYESDMSVLQFLKLNKDIRTEAELCRYFSDFAIKQAIRSGKIMRRKGRLFV